MGTRPAAQILDCDAMTGELYSLLRSTACSRSPRSEAAIGSAVFHNGSVRMQADALIFAVRGHVPAQLLDALPAGDGA